MSRIKALLEETAKSKTSYRLNKAVTDYHNLAEKVQNAHNEHKELRRRNTALKHRSIYVFTSETLKQAFITSNTLYNNKPSYLQCRVAKHGLCAQKKTSQLFNSQDLMCTTKCTNVEFGDVLNKKKAEIHDELVAAGWCV